MLLHHFYSSFLCTMFMISSELKSFQNMGTHIILTLKIYKFSNLLQHLGLNVNFYLPLNFHPTIVQLFMWH